MITGEWQLTGEGVKGWAKSPNNARPLWVELWVDNLLLGIALANLEKPEGCGFWLPLGSDALSTATEIKVCIANTEQELPQRQEDESTASGKSALIGAIQVDRGMTISGWVVDPDKTEVKLQIHAEVDDKLAAECIAGERRYRPIQADGHGFSLQLPESYADGESHTVKICDEYARQVPGSPFRIRLFPQNLGSWLKGQKKLDKPMLDTLAGLLEKMEQRLPGLVSESNYSAWKKAFPVPLAQGRQKASLCVFGQKNLAQLKGQQGVDLRDGKDYFLLPAGNSQFHANALGQMLAALKETGADIVYADAETASGEPLLKPAFDREAFLAADYLGPVLVKRELYDAAGLLPEDNELAARFKLVMAAAQKGKIAHLPLPLSVSPDLGHKEQYQQLVQAWLTENYPGSKLVGRGIQYALKARPRVSIIIPTRDHGDLLRVCLESLRNTEWPDYEIVIVDNGSVEDDALKIMEQAETAENICVLRKPGVFNYAALNNDAARVATGELLCFLNNDTEAAQPQWLAEMVTVLAMAGEQAGAVGAKLLWPNGLVQHGGVIIGTHQLAAHVGNQWLADEPGYMDRNQFTQQYSAVTAACLLTPKDLFLESGGFDARRFPIAFNDVDYCLRLGSLGKKIYWTPHATLFHHESASRGADLAGSSRARAEREGRFFRMLWGHYDDPFYNPNLPLSASVEPFLGLAFPPRSRNPRVV